MSEENAKERKDDPTINVGETVLWYPDADRSNVGMAGIVVHSNNQGIINITTFNPFGGPPQMREGVRYVDSWRIDMMDPGERRSTGGWDYVIPAPRPDYAKDETHERIIEMASEGLEPKTIAQKLGKPGYNTAKVEEVINAV